MNEKSHTDRVNTLVVEALRAQADEAPNGAGLLDAVSAVIRHGAAVRRRIAVGAAVGAVAVGTVTLSLGTHGRSSETTAPAPAPGMRAYTFHGLRVDAPESWPLNPYDLCDRRFFDAVFDNPPDRGHAACPYGGLPRAEYQTVEFGLANHFPAADAGSSAVSRPVTVDGVSGTLLSGTDRLGSTVRLLIVPSLNAAVEITVRTPALADAMIASARVVHR